MIKWLTLMKVRAMAVKLYNDYIALRKYKELMNKRLFGSFIMSFMLSFAMKKRGPSLEERMRYRMRQALTCVQTSADDVLKERAENAIYWFLNEADDQRTILYRFKYTVEKVMKIQKTFKRIKLKRVVRRALLNMKWENYIEMD